MYRFSSIAAVMILEVYAKKTKKIPPEVIERCQQRLKDYDEIAKKAAKKAKQETPRKGKN
jgi:phage-related protein